MNRLLLCVGLLAAAGGSWLVVASATPAVALSWDVSDASLQEEQWSGRIAAVGGARAYAELLAGAAALVPQDQHTLAHAFGGALYEIEGEGALVVCDTQLNFGCFHEFLGRAITSLGLSSVVRLNEACATALPSTSVSCQHGIGHGVVAAVGYTDQALDEALQICSELPDNDRIGGCYGGVFMEYNLQTMLGEQGRIRPVAGHTVQYPCDRLSLEYQPACYFSQPQWWHQTLRSESPTSSEKSFFTTLGAWCKDVPEGALRQKCYEGIGNITAPSAQFDTTRARHLCEATSSNPRYQLLCKSYTANSFTIGGSGKKLDGEPLCEGLEGEYRAYCLSYANNQSNIVNERPPLP